MEADVGEVMPTAVETEKLVIQHVRKPGQRKPVRIAKSSEGPGQTIPRQTGTNLRVFGDIDAIVETDETVTPNLAINRKNRDEQQQAYQQIDERIARIGRRFLSAWGWLGTKLGYWCQSGRSAPLYLHGSHPRMQPIQVRSGRVPTGSRDLKISFWPGQSVNNQS